MMDGLTDVEAFLAGSKKNSKTLVPQEVNVKANRLGRTQARLSDTFGFSFDAIKRCTEWRREHHKHRRAFY
jgi:hypothetical protein